MLTKGKVLAASLALVGLCSACSSGSSSTAHSGGSSSAPATMTFWNGFTASDRPFVEQIVKNYNASSKNKVNMTIEPWDTVYQKLQTSLPTGQGPDIPALWPQLVKQYASAGLLQPLDDLYGPGGLNKSVIPPAWTDASTYNGHIYAAPMSVTTVMLYYNTKMFADAGIASPPKTMDELFQDAAKLTKPGQYGLVLPDNSAEQWWSIFASAYGGGLVSADGKSSMLLNPATVKSFQAWATAQKESHITPVGLGGTDADQLFQTGKAAMDMEGSWATTGFTQAKVPYDVAKIPVGPSGTEATLAVGATLTVGKGSKDKQQAEDFIKYWMQKDSQLIYAGGSGSSPARTDMAAQLAALKNPFPAKFASMLPYAHIYLVGLKNADQIDSDVITPAVQAILRGADVMKTLQSANGKLNNMLKQG